MHPIAFWLGFKIFNKYQGLTYEKKSNSLHMYGIDIESINLTKNGIEKQFILSKEKNVTSLIRSKNSFIKFDYNNGLNFEYSIFKNYKKYTIISVIRSL